jgi:hypothetical protein
MDTYPQVVLFGSIAGNWREDHVIPVLDELGVTYYNPVSPTGWWSKELGDREAEVMAHCETIVMMFNHTSPSFTALAEAGWAALGVALRGQHFIMQIDHDYPMTLPSSMRDTPEGPDVEKALQHWATSSRYLVYHHARQFNHPNLHLVEDMAGVLASLRKIYSKA